MSIPVRNLAEYGVISDASATDIPLNAWTMARNARFVDNRIRRSLGFRKLLTSLLTTAPYFLAGSSPQNAPDAIYYTDQNGKIYRRLTTGLHTDVSASAHTDTATGTPFSHCTLGEFTIMNRSTEQPWWIDSGESAFQALPGWDSGWTAGVVRVYKNFLVALNITKDGTSYPNLVKTSDAAEVGSLPQTWDHTDPENLATENPINQLTTPLIDGERLGDDFYLYTSDQVWRMSYSGSEFVFDYRDTGIIGGVINANCVVLAENTHFVFGVNDIYAHDGVTPRSIADGRVRDFVFNNLDRSKVDRCFVFHDARASSVRFYFPSASTDMYWQNPTQCNAVAVYNYRNNTWAFDDAPNVCGVAAVNPSTIYSYSTYSGTYAAATSSYSTVAESTRLVPVAAVAQLAGGGGAPSITAQAYALDLLDDGAQLSGLALDEAITPPVILQKTIVDLDELGLSLLSYKEIQRIIPQISVSGTGTFQWRVGFQARRNKPITWDPYVSYDPENDDTVDFFDATAGCYPGGRLVSFEMKFSDLSEDFTFTSYDIDITSTAQT